MPLNHRWNRTLTFPSFWIIHRKIRHAAYRMIRGGTRQATDTWTSASWLRFNTSEMDTPPTSSLSRTNATLHVNGSDKDDAQAKLSYIYGIAVPVMVTGCILSLLLNLLILACVRWVRRPLSPTLCLSVSLSVTNAYASTVLAIGLVVNSLLPTVHNVDLVPFYTCYILVLEVFRMSGLITSVFHLLALAVNHYIGILRPLHYAAIVTRKTAAMSIIAIWTTPIAFFFVYFSGVPGQGFQSSKCQNYMFVYDGTYRLTVSLLFFLPLLLMTGMYIHIFLAVRRHKIGFINYPSARQLHKNVKAVITTLLILGTYLVGWIPAVLFFALTCSSCPVPLLRLPGSVRVPVSIFINCMIVVKSFVDPIIYVVRMPEIKDAMKSMWTAPCDERSYADRDYPLCSRSATKRFASILSINNRKTQHNGNRNLTT